MSDIVSQVYEVADELNATPGKAYDSFQKLLELCTQSDQAKQLCAGIIPKHFGYYSDLQDLALNSMVDMCEVENKAVRKASINAMPEMSKKVPAFQVKICDILTQLLQTEGDELDCVKRSIHKMIDINVEAAINGLFVQIAGGESSVREKGLQFVCTELIDKRKSTIIGNKTAEAALHLQVERALQTAVGAEVGLFVGMLSQLRAFQGPRRRQLVNFILVPLKTNADFLPMEAESRECYKTCARLARNYIKDGDIEALSTYTYTKVLPVLSKVPLEHLEGIAKTVAEGVNYGMPENIPVLVSDMMELLLNIIPKPLQEASEKEHINYTLNEALLIVFHGLAAKDHSFLGESEEAVERKKTLQRELLYLAQMSKAQSGQVDKALAIEKDPKTIKIFNLAKKSTFNIVEMIKDLLRTTPIYRLVKPSWIQPEDLAHVAIETAIRAPGKPPVASPSERFRQPMASGPKRPLDTPEQGARKRPMGGVYQPPQGKYSSNLKDAEFREQGGSGRGRRGGRGGWRGDRPRHVNEHDVRRV